MKISIITVCYNAKDDIEKTVLSVIKQTYKDYEYIVIDGGSTDGTLDIINKYKDKISYSISEPDRGVYDAMNKALKEASGEWVNFMNAGDVFADDRVLEYIFEKEYGNDINFIYSDVYQRAYNGEYFLRKMCISEEQCNVIHQGVIYKKKLHDYLGYYLVTKKIIVSDLLFFLSVPLNEVQKTDVVIARYSAQGLSDKGSWCLQQAFCASVVFRKRGFWQMVFNYVAVKIYHLIPRRIREKGLLKNM